MKNAITKSNHLGGILLWAKFLQINFKINQSGRLAIEPFEHSEM
jgi:hypothetical protein